jgi:hypothetical protein
MKDIQRLVRVSFGGIRWPLEGWQMMNKVVDQKASSVYHF